MSAFHHSMSGSLHTNRARTQAKYERFFFQEMEGKASWGDHRWGLQLCWGRVGLRCYSDNKRAVFQYHLPYAIRHSVSLDFFVSIDSCEHVWNSQSVPLNFTFRIVWKCCFSDAAWNTETHMNVHITIATESETKEAFLPPLSLLFIQNHLPKLAQL